jgi:predicted O-methyltransferase YrrM|tara:strand:+ start:2919 stop:3473 length:555 start_codon:yes stop_codon:yes gene_type:complete
MNTTTSEVLDSIHTISKTKGNVWPITKEQGEYLAKFIKDNNIQSVLELGISHAFSTIYMAEALKETGGKLIGIDNNASRNKIAKKNLEKCNIKNVELKGGSCQQIIPTLDEKFDLVFIDISKDQYINVFSLILPQLKSTAFVIADNMSTHPEETAEYRDLVQSFETKTVDIGNGFEVTSIVTNK